MACPGAESLLASKDVPGLAGVVIQRAIRAAELAGQLAQWGREWERGGLRDQELPANPRLKQPGARGVRLHVRRECRCRSEEQ
jgi:hypothetical protein